MDDACGMNDSGEFGRLYKDIYPKELELKCEHMGNHATFLEIDITICDGIVAFKLYECFFMLCYLCRSFSNE